MISWGHSGLASVHSVCQNVSGFPSTAFVPRPFSLAVSSLSTLMTVSLILLVEATWLVVVIEAAFVEPACCAKARVPIRDETSTRAAMMYFIILAGRFSRKLVRIRGLEPLRLAALPPQSSVSANSTICARNPAAESRGPKAKLFSVVPPPQSSFLQISAAHVIYRRQTAR